MNLSKVKDLVEAELIEPEDRRGNYTFQVTRTTTTKRINWLRFWIEEHMNVSRFTIKGSGGVYFSPSTGRDASYEVAFACIAARRVYEERKQDPS